MLSNPNGKLEKLMSQLLIDEKYKIAIEQGLKKYRINHLKLNQMQPNQILQLYYSISNKFYKQQQQFQSQSWHQNQLKLYVWVLICFSFAKKRPIQQFVTIDWENLSQIFKNKKTDTLQYQALSISKKYIKHQKWCTEQIQMLSQIIKENQSSKKWGKIGKELFFKSNKKFLRTSKQCRQCWINHLDPKPLKSSWTVEEDYHLLEWAQKYKKKWCLVSKEFEGKRTQHMVKNRYKALHRIEIKKYTEKQLKFPKQGEIMLRLKEKLQFFVNQLKNQKQASQANNSIDIYFSNYYQLSNVENEDSYLQMKLDFSNQESELNKVENNVEIYDTEKQNKIHNQPAFTENSTQKQKHMQSELNQQNCKIKPKTMDIIQEYQNCEVQEFQVLDFKFQFEF